MKDLREIKGVEFGKWSGQLPTAAKSFMITEATFKCINEALQNGKRVVVGNNPKGAGKMLSIVNSRYHGRSIRTIRAI